MIDVATTAERLAGIRHRIAAAGGDPDAVTVVAVTKGFGPDAVEAATACGLPDVGENYAQELLAKAEDVAARPGSSPTRWHFLGAPQRNKIRALAPVVSLWQGVDRVEVVDRIASVRPGAAILVQIDLTGEPGRHGCRADEVGPLVERALAVGLDVQGLMGLGPAGDPARTTAVFGQIASLAGEHHLAVVSIGMSDDLDAAVAAGATMVRVGRALFGPRPGRAGMRR